MDGSILWDLNKLNKCDDVLFIGIVRNPYDWLGSFKRQPHHVAPELTKSWESFLLSEFWSTHNGNELMDDRNYETKNRYKNIFELREQKNKYLLYQCLN